MWEELPVHIVGALIANGILLSIGYVFFDRRKKQSLKKLYDRTATSATRTINKVLEIITDELLAFLYLSKAITGKEIEELVVAKARIQKADKAAYNEFRNKLLKFLNTDEVFELMVVVKEIPPTFWIPVFQAIRNLNVEANRYIDLFETTGSFDEVDYLNDLGERSESILNRLSLLQQKSEALEKIGSTKVKEQVFGELKDFVSACLKAKKILKEEELSYKPTIEPM
jgi:hypothetical protein